MALTRKGARYRIAELLRQAEFVPGKKAFSKVWEAQVKNLEGHTNVAMVWDGPLWMSSREVAAVETATINVGFMVNRTSPTFNEIQVEDFIDRCAEEMIQLVKEHLTEPDYWSAIEFASETYLDYPPIETGDQYRREIFSLRVHFKP